MSPENQIRLELLRSAPLDAWIALSEDESRIVAVGGDYREVSDKADLAGEPDAIIIKTPPVWGALSVQMSSTVIPYSTFPDSLGAPMYYAVLKVQLAEASPNSRRTKRFEALIDSGATRCLFHSGFASWLGIDLKSGIPEITNGIGGKEEVWLHDVTLYIPGGPVTIKAGFKENLPVGGLLGTSGFFDHYNITFEAYARQCILERVYYS